MVEAEEEWRADEGRFGHSQETNDVSRWQEENRRSTKAEMGKGQSSQQNRLEGNALRLLVKARLPILGGRAFPPGNDDLRRPPHPSGIVLLRLPSLVAGLGAPGCKAVSRLMAPLGERQHLQTIPRQPMEP